MSKNTILISIGNSKGGVGKSSLTRILANDLFNNHKLSVCVIDCDHRQKSVYNKRMSELDKIAKENEITSAQAKTAMKDKAYPIEYVHSRDFPAHYENLYGQFDIVLVDLPGNLEQKGVEAAYMICNLIIIPTRPVEDEIRGTKDFMRFLSGENGVFDRWKEHNHNGKAFWVLNGCKKNMMEYTQLMDVRDSMDIMGFGIPFLQTTLPDNKFFSRYASTINNQFQLPEKGDNVPQDIEDFTDEVSAIAEKLMTTLINN